MAWPRTPKSRLIVARRLNRATGEWAECLYEELRPGDVFRSFHEGRRVHPVTLEEIDDDIGAVCDGAPERAFQRGEGFAVPIFFGPISDLLRGVTQ